MMKQDASDVYWIDRVYGVYSVYGEYIGSSDSMTQRLHDSTTLCPCPLFRRCVLRHIRAIWAVYNTSMQPSPVFWQRFSCRSFQDKPIPPECLDALLEAARWAPSAGNLQPWKFYILRNANLKKELAQAGFGQGFLFDAPVVIVVCALPEQSAKNYGERGRTLYCLQDTAAAAENILLQATMLGLGSAWVGAFRETAVVRALSLPEGEKPVALIPVGYPAEPMPQDRVRLPMEKIVTRME